MTPTPGMPVLLYTDPEEREIHIAVFDEAQPLAATVAFVNADGTVNLMGIDQEGASFIAPSVPLIQPGQPSPIGDHCRTP